MRLQTVRLPSLKYLRSRMQRLLRLRGLLAMCAMAFLPLMLAGCSASADKEALVRDLPFGPAAIATPVQVAPPRVGEICVSYAARERAGRIANAHRLTAYDRWYADLRTTYLVKPE